MTRSSDSLIVGIGGHAVAVDPATGEEIWRTRLKSDSHTTVYRRGNRVYAGSGGELFCLDAATGNVLWRNKLKRLGMGVVAFPGDSEVVAALAAAAARAAAAT
jgi:outer membrane protein assembly factor BamB